MTAATAQVHLSSRMPCLVNLFLWPFWINLHPENSGPCPGAPHRQLPDCIRSVVLPGMTHVPLPLQRRSPLGRPPCRCMVQGCRSHVRQGERPQPLSWLPLSLVDGAGLKHQRGRGGDGVGGHISRICFRAGHRQAHLPIKQPIRPGNSPSVEEMP